MFHFENTWYVDSDGLSTSLIVEELPTTDPQTGWSLGQCR